MTKRVRLTTDGKWSWRPQIWLGVATFVLLFCGVMAVPVAVSPVHHPVVSVVQPEVPDCRKVACIALTFDDGPNRATTSRILETLEKEHVSATFFLVGSRIQANADLVRRMYKDGDEIGNHSWSHPDMTTLKPGQVRQQIILTQEAIEKAGVPAPTLFRPPYGEVNTVMRKNIALTFMFWNEDPRDWAAHRSAEVALAVESSARPGGVVDMHDIYDTTAEALPKVIRNLKSRQYHFVTVSQLLDLHPGQKGDFYGRMPPPPKVHVP